VPTGISVTNIVNTNGTITADVAAGCDAATGDNTVVLEVSDGSLPAIANLIINVAPNQPPDLVYAEQETVTSGASRLITPLVAIDQNAIQSITLQSAGTYTGSISVDNLTGVVSVGNGAPDGNHTISIRATDSCGAITDASFSLIVGDAKTLAVSKAGSGSGTVRSQPSGVDCGPKCSGLFVEGSSVQLAAIPAAMSVFKGWDAGLSFITMDTDKSVLARFMKVTAQSCKFENPNEWGLRFRLGSGITPSVCSQQCLQGGGTGQFKINKETGFCLCETSAKRIAESEPPAGSCDVACADGSPCGGPDSLYSTYQAGPGIASTAVTRSEGSAAANSPIGSMLNASGIAASLPVSISSDGTTFAASATKNGVTVSNIAVDAAGQVTADVSTPCGASTTELTLKVTQGQLTNVETLKVNVTPNTAPELSYATPPSVIANGSLTVNPLAWPSDNGAIQSIVVQSKGTFTGTISVNSSGVVSISNAGPAGSHTINIRATDDCGVAAEASFKLNVGQLKQSITFGALTGKTFGDPDFTVSATSDSGLPVSFAATGNCTVTPVSSGTVHLTGAGSCTVTASQAGNSTYIAAANVAQSFNIARANQSITFGVLTNKTPGDPDFTVNPTATSGLTVSLAATGNCTVTPSSPGTVHLTGAGSCTIAASQSGDANYNAAAAVQRTFSITGVNTAPTANNDVLTNMAEDGAPRAIPFADLTANDSNETGQTLLVISANDAVGGTAVVVDGFVVFTPTENYNGPASFSYVAQDNGTTNGVPDPKASEPALVQFNITEVNDAPTVFGDTLPSVAEDSGERTIAFADLTANDVKGPPNESGQTLVVMTVSNPVGVAVSIVEGTVRVTPLPDYNGLASFQYTVRDNGTTSGFGEEKLSGPAVVQFNVTEVNDAPTVNNDTLSSVAEDSGPRTILFTELTANDSKGPANESDQILIVTTVGDAVGGTVSIVDGKVVFTPTADYNGPASFKYTVEDNGTTNGVTDPLSGVTAIASFNITAQADAPSVTNATTNANTQTTTGLVISRNPADGPEVTHFRISGITGGLLFKNDGITPINNGDFITFAEGTAGLKFTPGPSIVTNGSFTVQASLSASEAGLQPGTATAIITVNPVGGVLRFSSINYSVAEGAGSATITVERTGDTSQAVTVDYAGIDHSSPADFIPCTSPGAGFASSRCDFTTAIGTLRFAAGETTKTFNVLISQDNYVEGPETLELALSNLTGGAVFGVPQTAILSITDDVPEPVTNTIDNAADFVRSQYHDFLNREPDAPGLAFWTENIEKCNDSARRPAGLTVAECIDKQRESTAVAFFMSPEFQITGGFVYHLYKGSLTAAPQDASRPSLSLCTTCVRYRKALWLTTRSREQWLKRTATGWPLSLCSAPNSWRSMAV
jgi:hypothetical protein